MKIAMLTSYDDGGTWNIAQPIAQALVGKHEVWLVAVGKGHERAREQMAKVLDDYDVIHFWNLDARRWFGEISAPTVLTIHHIPFRAMNGYFRAINEFQPSLIHVVDPWMVRFLGMAEFTNVRHIPQAFDHTKWPVLPPPEDFTVGYIGTAESDKRFEVIEAAAKLAGVPCVGLSSEPWKPAADVHAAMAAISCYVVASFNDAGPLPAQEALLSGRPVITTHVGAMEGLITDHRNGRFYDGSAESLAEAILNVKATYMAYAHFARQTQISTVSNVLEQYERMYNSVAQS